MKSILKLAYLDPFFFLRTVRAIAFYAIAVISHAGISAVCIATAGAFGF
jgi:hypothetical protein